MKHPQVFKSLVYSRQTCCDSFHATVPEHPRTSSDPKTYLKKEAAVGSDASIAQYLRILVRRGCRTSGTAP